MPNRNQQTAIGHLGKDPEVRYISNGDAVCNLTVAATEKWKDKAGEWKEKTEWIKATIFGKLADLVGKEFKKGDAIHIEGKQATRKWQDQSGQDRYTTEMNVNYVARPIYVRKESSCDRAKSDDMDDDIPF